MEIPDDILQAKLESLKPPSQKNSKSTEHIQKNRAGKKPPMMEKISKQHSSTLSNKNQSVHSEKGSRKGAIQRQNSKKQKKPQNKENVPNNLKASKNNMTEQSITSNDVLSDHNLDRLAKKLVKNSIIKGLVNMNKKEKRVVSQTRGSISMPNSKSQCHKDNKDSKLEGKGATK